MKQELVDFLKWHYGYAPITFSEPIINDIVDDYLKHIEYKECEDIRLDYSDPDR